MMDLMVLAGAARAQARVSEPVQFRAAVRLSQLGTLETAGAAR